MTKSSQNFKLKSSSLKCVTLDIISDTIKNAQAKKEVGVSYINILPYLPKTHKHYLNAEAPRIPLNLPEWKYTHSKLKSCMYQVALAQKERESDLVLVPFVFILSESIRVRGEESKQGLAAYLLKRLADSLRRALDRSPELWFSIEFAGNKDHAHIQGSILLTPREVKIKRLARFGFYRVNDLHKKNLDDEQLKFKSAALRFRHGKRKRLFKTRGQLATDMGWAGYNSKESGGSRQRTGDKSNTSATLNLKRAGKVIYADLRQATAQKKIQSPTKTAETCLGAKQENEN